MSYDDKKIYLSHICFYLPLFAMACLVSEYFILAIVSLLVSLIALYWLSIVIRMEKLKNGKNQKAIPFTD